MPDAVHRLQLSLVLSQRTWPQVGDLDDCWVLSILQSVLACIPWAHLPGTTAVRTAAGIPDRPNAADGGRIGPILKASTTLWPILDGKLTAIRGGAVATVQAGVRAGRPASVAIDLNQLPARLRYQATSGPLLHQVTLGQNGTQLLLANPLKAMGQPWDAVDWSDVLPAIRAYGGGSAYAVLYPTAETMAPYAPGVDELVAAAHGQPDPAAIAAATEAGRQAGWDLAATAARASIDTLPADPPAA